MSCTLRGVPYQIFLPFLPWLHCHFFILSSKKTPRKEEAKAPQLQHSRRRPGRCYIKGTTGRQCILNTAKPCQLSFCLIQIILIHYTYINIRDGSIPKFQPIPILEFWCQPIPILEFPNYL